MKNVLAQMARSLLAVALIAACDSLKHHFIEVKGIAAPAMESYRKIDNALEEVGKVAQQFDVQRIQCIEPERHLACFGRYALKMSVYLRSSNSDVLVISIRDPSAGQLDQRARRLAELVEARLKARLGESLVTAVEIP